MHKDVALIVFYRDNKILLQDRRNIPHSLADWGFFGGKILAGETPEQAVLRETREELSFDLGKYTFVKQFHLRFKDETCTAFVFVAQCPELSELKQLEGQGMVLVTEKEALKLNMATPDYDIIKYVLEFLRAGKHKLGE